MDPNVLRLAMGAGGAGTAPEGLFAWGKNNLGQLGLGDTSNKSSPNQVGALTDWTQVVCGQQHTLAIKSDGTLWGWGNNNSNHQLGLGVEGDKSSPVQIGSDTNWSFVAAGSNSGFAIKTTGTLWAWGNNQYGHLGVGDTNVKTSPVQVGSNTNWASVTSSSNKHTFFLTTSGALFVCGRNYYGQLGTGNTTYRSSPVQVSGTWNSVATGFDISWGIKSNGRLYAWGKNNFGQLGVYNTTNYSSPVQIYGGGTDWAAVYSSGNNAIARKTGNTIWGWGSNSTGQLGINNTNDQSAPVQIGYNTWSKIFCGYNFTLGIRSGNLWAWGFGGYGSIGNGLTFSRSTPVQVGSLSTWDVLPNKGGHPSSSFAIIIP